MTIVEFERLLPAFAQAYETRYRDDTTVAGTPRQRRAGGGAKGKLQRIEDKLLFSLVYQKTYPLQTMQGLHFEMSQSQANEWIHRLLPVLQKALATLEMKPEREASGLTTGDALLTEPADLLIDGSERRRQRPKDNQKQRQHYSGKKKAHTDKNLLIANGQTNRVLYLSPTEPGHTHDKKMADNANITYPTATTLGQDSGFQGYQPSGVALTQPKKA
ncbi:MAG: transposase [Ardenticatenaceae bacterium]|nr:transposase [Ardenticatenaceae bacterium]MCB9443400.1 transposase [Ardenticatenaceae bacterium]